MHNSAADTTFTCVCVVPHCIVFTLWRVSALFHVVNTLVWSDSNSTTVSCAYTSSKLFPPKLWGAHTELSFISLLKVSPFDVSLTRLFDWMWLLNAMASSENCQSLCSSLFDWTRAQRIPTIHDTVCLYFISDENGSRFNNTNIFSLFPAQEKLLHHFYPQAVVLESFQIRNFRVNEIWDDAT